MTASPETSIGAVIVELNFIAIIISRLAWLILPPQLHAMKELEQTDGASLHDTSKPGRSVNGIDENSQVCLASKSTSQNVGGMRVASNLVTRHRLIAARLLVSHTLFVGLQKVHSNFASVLKCQV